jgi:hypothetical protein|tara:strand:- start:356 stop:976 length:621 start_codon:yes stop_codon:yes gene_type:complete
MSNLEKIEQFLDNKQNNILLINQVNEEIGSFYLSVISYEASKKNLNLKNFADKSSHQSSDLFLSEPIYYVYSNSLKEVSNLTTSTKKLIIISDYKNFKKYSKSVASINGYQYQDDINIFISKEIPSVNNSNLAFLKSYPYMVVSEILKIQINDKNYFFQGENESNKSTILDLRRRVLILKKEGKIKSLFNVIKNEALIKKFSFLTY